MGLLNDLWAEARAFLGMIDWWVAIRMLGIFLLGLCVLIGVILWLV